MMTYEEERMKKVEADFRETIKGDWGTEWWNPIAFIDSFSKDFIREMKDKLFMHGGAIKESIKGRG